MNLYDKIMKLYPALTVEDFNIPDRKIWLRNDSDGRGDYICEWNHPDYTKPTQQQLDALDAKE